MLQVKHGESPTIVTNIFTQVTWQYDFRQNRDFRILSGNTLYDGSERIAYLGPKFEKMILMTASTKK